MTGTDWTRGVLAGAAFGGIGWGLMAAHAVGVSGDGPSLTRADAAYLPVAVIISFMCLVVAGVLPRIGMLRTVAVGLVVAPASGWFVVGLLYLQAFAVAAAWW